MDPFLFDRSITSLMDGQTALNTLVLRFALTRRRRTIKEGKGLDIHIRPYGHIFTCLSGGKVNVGGSKLPFGSWEQKKKHMEQNVNYPIE